LLLHFPWTLSNQERSIVPDLLIQNLPSPEEQHILCPLIGLYHLITRHSKFTLRFSDALAEDLRLVIDKKIDINIKARMDEWDLSSDIAAVTFGSLKSEVTSLLHAILGMKFDNNGCGDLHLKLLRVIAPHVTAANWNLGDGSGRFPLDVALHMLAVDTKKVMDSGLERTFEMVSARLQACVILVEHGASKAQAHTLASSPILSSEVRQFLRTNFKDLADEKTFSDLFSRDDELAISRSLVPRFWSLPSNLIPPSFRRGSAAD